MKPVLPSNLPLPSAAVSFLRFFCKEELLEEIEGDLHEYFGRTAAKKGRRWALIACWYHLFHFLRPFAIKKFNVSPLRSNSNTRTMLRFNLTIAFRNLNKYRFYSFLNISGLALGLATCLFITLFVMDELRYDKSYPDHERIYRIASDLTFGNNRHQFPVAPAPMAEAFAKDFPEIEAAGKMRDYGKALVQRDDNFFKTEDVYYASQGVLDIFQFPVVYGTLDNAISQPNKIALAHSTAQKMFGDDNPVGKTVVVDEWLTAEVAVVYQDLPLNSHMHPKMLISMENDESNNNMWLSNNYYTFFKLHKGNDPEALVAKFDDVYPRYFGPQVEQMVGITWEEALKGGTKVHYYLQPITDIHLYSSFPVEMEANGSIENVYIFMAIGLFVLLLACINFMNLSTARASIRAKEVGIKKVLGSVKKQLIYQFLTESVLYSFLSMLIAVALLIFLLPAFNGLTGKEVSDLLFQKPQIWAGLLAAVVFIGLLAGVYPAFYLSRFQPTDVLKGSYLAGGKSNWLRSVLVVFQFSISLVLIIGSMIVYNQLNYSYSKDLGFSKDQVVVIDNVSNLGKNKALALKNELLKHSEVSSASVSDFYPLSGSMSDAPFVRDDATDGTEGAVSMQVWGVDYDYVPTFDMKLVAGRNFNREMASDSAAIIINETAAKKFGYENPIGRKIRVLGDFNHQGKSEFQIVGIIKDFHYESLRSGISPVMLFVSKYGASAMSVRLTSDNYHDTMAFIEASWKEIASNRPFEYHFLDQTFEAKYLSEKKLAIIFSIFSGLAIVIGCLGLFGLSAFTAEKRRKELGIRKVLGASVPNLVRLLFSEFSKLLLLSILLAVPVAWYVMDVWLSNFAFRVPLGVSTFVIASVAVVAIGLLTVSIQSLKAASSNPVDNLKYE